MLQKVVGTIERSHATRRALTVAPKRTIYAAGTEPKVFINKHTKVITQGMTGKHVSHSDGCACGWYLIINMLTHV